MSLTFLSPQRISRDLFRQILVEANSPAAPEAYRLYDICQSAGIDSAVALAFFQHESNYGTTGINAAYNLHNFGSVRTPYDPNAATVVPVPGNGAFAKYATWSRSLKDWTDRIRLRYVANGYETVEQAIPKYAPADDNNDVQAYINAVETAVAGWQAKELQTMATTGFADRDDLLTPGDNRPGTKLVSFGSCTIHETANESATATAAMHKKYWDAGGSGRTVSSAHVVADSTESIQLIPMDEQAWHAGDATGNMTSVGFEICVNSRPGFITACRKVAKVTAKVLADHKMQPIADVTVRRHGSWPGTTHKQCPQHLTAGDWGLSWSGFIQMVMVEYAALGSPPPAGYIPPGSPNGIAIHPSLVNYWSASGGVWQASRYALGFPTTPFNEGSRVQVFERGRLRLKLTGEIQGLLLAEVGT